MNLVIFCSLGQVKGGIDFGRAQLTERRQLEGDWLSQAITRLQLQLGRLGWDLVEVSEDTCPKLQLTSVRVVSLQSCTLTYLATKYVTGIWKLCTSLAGLALDHYTETDFNNHSQLYRI